MVELREVEGKEAREDRRCVSPGTYSKIIDKFISQEISQAEVTLEESDVLGDEIPPARTLANGLRMNIKRRNIDGVAVSRDGDRVFLVKQ